MRTKSQRAREENENEFVDDGNKRVRTYSEDHREERRRRKTNALPEINEITSGIAQASIMESDEDQSDGRRSGSKMSRSEKYKSRRTILKLNFSIL